MCVCVCVCVCKKMSVKALKKTVTDDCSVCVCGGERGGVAGLKALQRQWAGGLGYLYNGERPSVLKCQRAFCLRRTMPAMRRPRGPTERAPYSPGALSHANPPICGGEQPPGQGYWEGGAGGWWRGATEGRGGEDPTPCHRLVFRSFSTAGTVPVGAK